MTRADFDPRPSSSGRKILTRTIRPDTGDCRLSAYIMPAAWVNVGDHNPPPAQLLERLAAAQRPKMFSIRTVVLLPVIIGSLVAFLRNFAVLAETNAGEDMVLMLNIPDVLGSVLGFKLSEPKHKRLSLPGRASPPPPFHEGSTAVVTASTYNETVDPNFDWFLIGLVLVATIGIHFFVAAINAFADVLFSSESRKLKEDLEKAVQKSKKAEGKLDEIKSNLEQRFEDAVTPPQLDRTRSTRTVVTQVVDGQQDQIREMQTTINQMRAQLAQKDGTIRETQRALEHALAHAVDPDLKGLLHEQTNDAFALMWLNTANAERLAVLNQVGLQRAQDIIANRPFHALGDLAAVPQFGGAGTRRNQVIDSAVAKKP